MNIAEFSKSDITGGGASRVAEELAIGLRSTGVMCDHWSRLSSAGFDASTRFSLYGGWTSKYFSRLHRLFALAGYPELLPLELISIIPTSLFLLLFKLDMDFANKYVKLPIFNLTVLTVTIVGSLPFF